MRDDNSKQECPTALSVLVTGAGRGIGRAIALRFAEEGARVIAAARTVAEIESTVAEVVAAGGTGLAVPLDVTDLASVESGLERALEFTGGVLDIVVNNAGIFAIQDLDQMEPETWYRMLAVNLNGPFHVARTCLPALERSRRAHLFNISSVAGQEAFPGNSAYCTTKYGLRGFGDALRLEWAERGIRVSTVYPGGTDTTIFDDVPGDWDRSTMNRPADVADVVWAAVLAPPLADVADLDVPNPRLQPES